MDREFFNEIVTLSNKNIQNHYKELVQSVKDEIAASAADGLYHVRLEVNGLVLNPNLLKEVCRELTSAGFRIKHPQYEDGLVVDSSEMIIYWGLGHVLMITSKGYIEAFEEVVLKLKEELAANEGTDKCVEISMQSNGSSQDYDGTLNRAERRALAGNKKQNHGWKKLQRKNRWKD